MSQTNTTNNATFNASYFLSNGLHKAITHKVLTNLAYLKDNQACYELLHGKKGVIDIEDLYQECALAICEYVPYYNEDNTLIIDKNVFASITNL